jgi:hypothetical protein
MKRFKLLPMLALLLAPVVSCSDTTSPSSGSMTLLLTDAPGDFQKAVVTISQIYLQGAAGGDNGGRLVLLDKDTTVDLLTLANSTAELVKDTPVPEGTYSELRFVVTGGYVEIEQADGSTKIYASSPDYAGLPEGAQVAGELRMPSFAQSGLKVKLPGDQMNVAGGERKVVLVDFDVAQSFGHEAGASGAWVMHPVIMATELQLSGSVAVSVTKDAAFTGNLADFKAVLEDTAGTQTELALTDDDQNGTFEAKFQYLLPMDYQLSLKAPDGVTFTTDPTLPVTVTVGAGDDATRAIVVK